MGPFQRLCLNRLFLSAFALPVFALSLEGAALAQPTSPKPIILSCDFDGAGESFRIVIDSAKKAVLLGDRRLRIYRQNDRHVWAQEFKPHETHGLMYRIALDRLTGDFVSGRITEADGEIQNPQSGSCESSRGPLF